MRGCALSRKLRLEGRLALLLAALSVSCQPDSGSRAGPRGELGVFYGGQVQRRLEVTLSEVNPPTLGFRIHLPKVDHETPWRLQWHVVRPGPLGRRVREVHEQKVPQGRQLVDQVVEVPEGSPLGTFNVRVEVDDQLVIDRALVLKPPG